MKRLSTLFFSVASKAEHAPLELGAPVPSVMAEAAATPLLFGDGKVKFNSSMKTRKNKQGFHTRQIQTSQIKNS